MRIHIRLIPPDIIAHYNLNDLVDEDVCIYTKIIRGMYGLPEVGILANNSLTQRLSNHGYYQVKQAPGFWRHVWKPI